MLFLCAKRIKEPPEDGIYIHGLFIEGANWSIIDNSLVEQMPKVVISEVPVIHFVVSNFDIFFFI